MATLNFRGKVKGIVFEDFDHPNQDTAAQNSHFGSCGSDIYDTAHMRNLVMFGRKRGSGGSVRSSPRDHHEKCSTVDGSVASATFRQQ